MTDSEATAFQAYTCNAANSTTVSTVICEACPTTTDSAVDIVTRSSEPTTSCTGPALTAVYATANGTASMRPSAGITGTTAATTKATVTPITAGSNKLAGSIGGVVAVIVAAAYAL